MEGTDRRRRLERGRGNRKEEEGKKQKEITHSSDHLRHF